MPTAPAARARPWSRPGGSRDCGRGGPVPIAHAPQRGMWRRTLGSLGSVVLCQFTPAHGLLTSSPRISPLPLMTFSLIAVGRLDVRCVGRRYCAGPGGADGALCHFPSRFPGGLLMRCLATVAWPGHGAWRQVPNGARKGHAGPDPAGGRGRGPPGDKDIRW